MNKLTVQIYDFLLTGVLLAYRDGKSSSLSPVKKYTDKPKVDTAFNEIDKSVLNHFRSEIFQVASVGSYELQEKLKALALKVKTDPEIKDPTKSFKEGAFKLITQYVPSDKWPRGAWLETNLRTAMRSSFYASQYNKLQDPDMLSVYPAYQYKTQEDSSVREEHARLNNRVYLATDPIWSQIWPPNGWNCRCYVMEVDRTELKDYEAKHGKVSPTSPDELTKDVNDAAIHPDFKRNAALEKSIYGKWLQDQVNNLPAPIKKETEDFSKRLGLKADAYNFENELKKPVEKELIEVKDNKIEIGGKEYELKDYELKALEEIKIYTGRGNKYDHNKRIITVNPDTPDDAFHEIWHRIDAMKTTDYSNNDLSKEKDFQTIYKTKKEQVYEILRYRVLPDLSEVNRRIVANASSKELKELFTAKKDGFFTKGYLKYIRRADEVIADGGKQWRLDPANFKKYAVDFNDYFSKIVKNIK